MAWMFRWLSGLLSRLRSDEHCAAGPAWVEPSNAITRAILGGAVAELPVLAAETLAAEQNEAPQKTPATAPAIVTRTAQRARRRRAGRAA